LKFARRRVLVITRPLRRQIASEWVFDITFAPRAFEIFLALRYVTSVETAFPDFSIRRSALDVERSTFS
jgi:hypothetical protein